MATINDDMHSVNLVTPFISSHAYYGYVPCRTIQETQRSYVVERNDAGHSAGDRHCFTPMETDDEYCYNTTSSRLNNHCVIPETYPRRNCRLEVIDSQRRCRQQSDISRKNQKRSYSDDEAGRNMKKFREGSRELLIFNIIFSG